MKSVLVLRALLVVGLAGCGEASDMENEPSMAATAATETIQSPGLDADVVAQLVAAGVPEEKIGPTFVYASASTIKDEHLKLFAKMPELKTLSLGKTQITGEGLKDLNCPKLRSLLLFDTQVTDAAVMKLPALPALETLSLAGTSIDGRCLEHVAGYTSLTALELQNTKVTDSSLAPLSALKALSRLELKNSAITDAGLQNLMECPELYTLDLAKTAVTDAGAIAITKKVQLFNLNLNDTAVTDELIRNLVGTPSEKLCFLSL